MMPTSRPRWITVEGCNGVGKTYLATDIARSLGARCHRILELTDLPSTSLPGQIVHALRTHGDQFLRTGAPKTETQLLLALHNHRYETASHESEVILEDRGPWSVAVYQAVILHPRDERAALATARQILHASTMWRPWPDATVLLRDDDETCEHRFATRLRRDLTGDERRLMRRASRLYDELTGDVDRIHVIDRRRRSNDDILRELMHICSGAEPTTEDRIDHGSTA